MNAGMSRGVSAIGAIKQIEAYGVRVAELVPQLCSLRVAIHLPRVQGTLAPYRHCVSEGIDKEFNLAILFTH